jgi:hypothetical protein
MEIKRNGSQASDEGPVNNFTEAVRVAGLLFWLAPPVGSVTQEA